MGKFKAGAMYSIILVVNLNDQMFLNRDKYAALENKYTVIEKIIFRDNKGRDFGGYNAGYQLLKQLNYAGDVVFMNSSARGPYRDYWLVKYMSLFHDARGIGVCGVSLNAYFRSFQPHV